MFQHPALNALAIAYDKDSCNANEAYDKFLKDSEVVFKGGNWNGGLPFYFSKAINFKETLQLINIQLNTDFRPIMITDDNTGISKLTYKKKKVIIDVSDIPDDVAVLLMKHYRHLGFFVMLEGSRLIFSTAEFESTPLVALTNDSQNDVAMTQQFKCPPLNALARAYDENNVDVLQIFGTFCKEFDKLWKGNNWDLHADAFNKAKNFKNLVITVHREILDGVGIISVPNADTGISKITLKRNRIAVDISDISDDIVLLVKKHFEHLGHCVHINDGIFSVNAVNENATLI